MSSRVLYTQVLGRQKTQTHRSSPECHDRDLHVSSALALGGCPPRGTRRCRDRVTAFRASPHRQSRAPSLANPRHTFGQATSRRRLEWQTPPCVNVSVFYWCSRPAVLQIATCTTRCKTGAGRWPVFECNPACLPARCSSYRYRDRPYPCRLVFFRRLLTTQSAIQSTTAEQHPEI